MIGLNIHYFQEFLISIPLLKFSGSKQVCILLRRGITAYVKPHQVSAIRSFCRRRQIGLIEYDRSEDINWSELSITHLISYGESNIGGSHILSQCTVEFAKVNGVSTALFQHGIWTKVFKDRALHFASERVFSWGSEHRRFFETRYVTEASSVRAEVTQSTLEKIEAIGSARYASYLKNGARQGCLEALGIEGYGRRVLIATNFQSPKDQSARSQLDCIYDLVRHNPTTQFIVKGRPLQGSLLLDNFGGGIYPLSMISSWWIWTMTLWICWGLWTYSFVRPQPSCWTLLLLACDACTMMTGQRRSTRGHGVFSYMNYTQH